MFHRRTSEAKAHGETATLTRRREGRGLGPFSGGQLTAIIIAIVIAIAFPVGAWAVSGSNVFVTDATSGARAKVSSNGELQTHPNGPLTVNGAVTATQTPPNSSYSNVTYVQEGACKKITDPLPAGKALVVTSITLELTFVSTGPVSVYPYQAKSNPCDGAVIERHRIDSVRESSTIPFTTGVPIKNGHYLSMNLTSVSGDAFAWVTVHGYLVASALCTVDGPPVGCY